jgi:ABC-2 type transport system permease protein
MRRWWIPFTAMVRMQAALITRYPVNFFAGILISFMGVFVLAMTVQMFSPPGSGLTADMGAMFYGYLLYLFVSDGVWRIGYYVRQEQVQGTFEGLYLTPAPKFAGLAARVVPLFTLTLVGASVALLAAGLLFGQMPLHNPLAGLGLLACVMAGAMGLGFAFAAYTLWVGDSAAVTANLVEFGLLVLCAMLFPFRSLPEPVRLISRMIPLSYSVDAFRSTLLGFPPGYPELAPIEIEIWISAVFGLAAPLVGYAIYRASVQRLRERGKLGQY